MCVFLLKFPIAPMGDSRFARCLQGGGVAVWGGTVTISSCTISGNTAGSVRAHAQKFPSHAHTLALILACATANASVNYSGCVPQRSCEVPIAPMGKCLSDMPNLKLAFQMGSILVLPGICTCQRRLQNVHRPLGRLTFCLLFVGRRCLRLLGHGLDHDNVFHNLREYSLQSA